MVTPAYGLATEQDFFVQASWATSDELEVRFSVVPLDSDLSVADASARLQTLSLTDQEKLRSGAQFSLFFPQLPSPPAAATVEFLSTWQSRPWVRTTE